MFVRPSRWAWCEGSFVCFATLSCFYAYAERRSGSLPRQIKIELGLERLFSDSEKWCFREEFEVEVYRAISIPAASCHREGRTNAQFSILVSTECRALRKALTVDLDSLVSP